MTSRTSTDPPYACTLPATGELMIVSRPNAYRSCDRRDVNARSLPIAPAGRTTSTMASIAAIAIAGIRTRLNIDPSRRPAQQRDEDRVHDQEENADDELPRSRCVLGRASHVAKRRHDHIGGWQIGEEAQRRCSRHYERERRDEPHDDCSRGDERPGTMSRSFPRRERQRIRGPGTERRGPVHATIERLRKRSALRTPIEVRGVRLRILE